MIPVVVMGVSGSGKSTVGRELATRINVPFLDGDDLHPAASKAKMAAGTPLTDADRAPWLSAIGKVLAAGPVVMACSALKRQYRDELRHAAPCCCFVYLEGRRALLMQRLAARTHHFMPAALLDSQLQTLEPPADDENALTQNIAETPAAIVQQIAAWLEHRCE